ncbi:MAG TPA: hypothetical protein ENK43_08940 [Planctomycetes bacterium]|nr:hypothetical protein [Planctomycetota bacterium]
MNRSVQITLVLFLFSTLTWGQLPDGPTWGRGRFRPSGHNAVFATADGCALCHSASDRALALRDALGRDVSPHGLWKGSMMAQAFRDPYYRAQVERETELYPEQKDVIEDTCLRCHAPMAHHSLRLAGQGERLTMSAAHGDPLAEDGVSCTVCHQTRPDNLGREESFDGRLDIRVGRRIFGPFPKPTTGPMRMHSAFTPEQGGHIRRSGLCGACHTLSTQAGEDQPIFHEQSPYLEWRNSTFGGLDESSRGQKSCQECHMPPVGASRLAHNPGGFDFNILVRPGLRGHVFVGPNAFMLDLIRGNAEALNVTAPLDSLQTSATASRALLQYRTAKLTMSRLTAKDGQLEFDLKVTNLSGHKFPTAYPSRRAILQVEVRQGGETVFLSGGFTEDGRIYGVENEGTIPHYDVIDDPSKVQVYQAVPVDAEGKPTTSPLAMVRFVKDNRILPQGWSSRGPHAKVTKPVGVEADGDFTGGSDTVHYRAKLATADAPCLIIARLLYQTVPPRWVDALRKGNGAAAKAFVSMYDDADTLPEPVVMLIQRYEP